MRRSLFAWSGRIPAVLPVRKNRASPLCLKLLIIKRNVTCYVTGINRRNSRQRDSVKILHFQARTILNRLFPVPTRLVFFASIGKGGYVDSRVRSGSAGDPALVSGLPVGIRGSDSRWIEMTGC